MDKIAVKVINPETVDMAENLMVLCARLTQHGEAVSSLEDLEKLMSAPHMDTLVNRLTHLPHPTLQKMGSITVAIVGASRRFLAQITRHQNEVKFMSASLQYSDMSGAASFVVPYELFNNAQAHDDYLRECKRSLRVYEQMVADGVNNDTAGYIMPQGMRNVLIVTATPYQWKHMIGQRTCRRNTSETQYVMLRVWEELVKINPAWFYDAGPFCQRGRCLEGDMTCKKPIGNKGPTAILQEDFPLLYERYDVRPL